MGSWAAIMTDTIKGISLKILAVSLFTVLMSIIKATADEVPTGEAVFFRSVFTLPVLFAFLWWSGNLSTGLKTERPLGHVLRGLAGSTSMGLRFFCLGILAFPDVTALSFTTPLVLTVFAALFLGETVGKFRISMVCLGFAGVLIILWDQLSFDTSERMKTIAVGLMLVSASMAALAQMFVRKMVATESSTAIVFYFMLTTSVLSLLTLPFGWVVPPLETTLLLVLGGIIGGVGQLCLTQSYRFAPASVVAPFDYTAMLLAIGIGYVWFNEVPTLGVVSGAALIVLAGVVIVLRERHLGIKLAAERQVRFK